MLLHKTVSQSRRTNSVKAHVPLNEIPRDRAEGLSQYHFLTAEERLRPVGSEYATLMIPTARENPRPTSE
jgi:hypothetical protein